MYDELIKRLWECASGECFNCSQYTPTTNASVCQKEMMKQAADAIEDKPRWISVEERPPDFEGAVLCMRKSYVHPGMRHQEIMYFDVDAQGFCNIDDVFAEPGNITHWMHLPPPPDHIGDGNEMVEPPKEET